METTAAGLVWDARRKKAVPPVDVAAVKKVLSAAVKPKTITGKFKKMMGFK